MIIYPVIQSAAIGSSVNFICIATGHGDPKPTITWKKKNDSNSIHLVVEPDYENTLSKLIITNVTSKDYGVYVCVMNNSAGVETSKIAVLRQGDLNLSVIIIIFF